MIIAKRKPFNEIVSAVSPFRRVLVVGCGTCVAVCLAGGEKEVGILASQLSIASDLVGKGQEFTEACVERQCDREFLRSLLPLVEETDAILSLACGAGVQFLAREYPNKPVLAGVDTTFIGINSDVGVWEKMCRACGECLLSITGGICPVTHCPKSMLNGPCGGAIDGRCETDPERECAWSLIWKRLEALGRHESIGRIQEPRDHRTANLPIKQVHPAYERRYEAHD